MAIISSDFVSEVVKLEHKLSSSTLVAQQNSEHAKSIQIKLDAIQPTMRWRDIHMFGLLGDKTKRKKYFKLRKQKTNFETAANISTERVTEFDQRIVNMIDNHLRETDHDYQALAEPYDVAMKAKDEATHLSERISHAMDKISDAKFTDTLDMATNGGAKVFAYLDNSKVSEAVEDIREALPDFKEAITAHDQSIKSHHTLSIKNQLGGNWGVLMYATFDNVFTDWLVLKKLDSMQENLEKLQSTVNHVEEIVDFSVEERRNALFHYVGKIRSTFMPQ